MDTSPFKSTIRFRTCKGAALVWFCLLMSIAAFAGGTEWEWEGVARVVALGEIHGSYGKLTDSLRARHSVTDEVDW